MAYTAIKYIQSTGTQYIDTTFCPDNNTSAEIEMEIVENLNFGTFFGIDDRFKLQERRSVTEGIYVYGNKEISFTIPEGKNVIKCDKNNLYLNGTLINTADEVTFESEYTLKIFAGIYDGNVETECIGLIKIYSLKIWDNGTLVYDLIPVLDENNVACLYNKVTGTYLYNAGTGDFVAGSVVTNPIITIGTPSRTKISSVSGYDQATVTFQSDMALAEWEARATVEGQTPGHGVGILVESGSELAANTDATVYVDDEELTSGDLEYTISIFGHGSNGYWSDGSYESINLINLNDVDYSEGTTISSDGTIIFDTGNLNTSSQQIRVERWFNNERTEGLAWIDTTGNASIQIEMSQSNTDIIRIGFFGNNDYTSVYFFMTEFEEGLYNLSFTVEELSLNHAVVNNVSLVKAV